MMRTDDDDDKEEVFIKLKYQRHHRVARNACETQGANSGRILRKLWEKS